MPFTQAAISGVVDIRVPMTVAPEVEAPRDCGQRGTQPQFDLAQLRALLRGVHPFIAAEIAAAQ